MRVPPTESTASSSITPAVDGSAASSSEAAPGTWRDALFDRLARRTSSGRFIPEIDGLRFVSIALVVAFHLTLVSELASGAYVLRPPLGITDVRQAPEDLLFRVLIEGNFGVEVFFMISGFILALPFLTARAGRGPKVDLKRYYLRRLTRIEPPYLVTMSLLFVITTLLGEGVGVSHFLASAAYVNQFLLGEPSRLNSVAWSLEVEVQFYCLLPLLAMVLCSSKARVRRLALLTAAGLAIAMQLQGLRTEPRLATLLINYLPYFLAGWLLADIYLFEWDAKPTTSRRWDLVSLIGWPLLFTGLVAWPLSRVLVAPALVLSLGAAAFRGQRTRQLLRNRLVTTVGGMAYSIYLVHWPVLVWVERTTRSFRTDGTGALLLWSLGVYLPLVLVVSLALFILVERPCMDPLWPTRTAVRLRALAGTRGYRRGA
jgi:peptidoglycan/LPS O-acetylase OafA/YrhL